MTSEWLVAAPLAPWGDDLWPLPHVPPTRRAGHARRPEPESPAAGRAPRRIRTRAGPGGAPGGRGAGLVAAAPRRVEPDIAAGAALPVPVGGIPGGPAGPPASARPSRPSARRCPRPQNVGEVFRNVTGGNCSQIRLREDPACGNACLPVPPFLCPQRPPRPACLATLIPVLDPQKQLLGRRPQHNGRRGLLPAPPGPALQAAAPARADGSRPARPSARRWPPPPASCPTSSLRLGPVARGGLIISSFLEQLQAPASAY